MYKSQFITIFKLIILLNTWAMICKCTDSCKDLKAVSNDCIQLMSCVQSLNTSQIEASLESMNIDEKTGFYKSLYNCPSSNNIFKQRRKLLYQNIKFDVFNHILEQNNTSFAANLYLEGVHQEVYQRTDLSILTRLLPMWNQSHSNAFTLLQHFLRTENITIGSNLEGSSSIVSIPAINIFEFYVFTERADRSFTAFKSFIHSSIQPLSYKRFNDITNCTIKVLYFLYGGENNMDIYENLDMSGLDSLLKCIDSVELVQHISNNLIYYRSGFFFPLKPTVFHSKISKNAKKDLVTMESIKSLMSDPLYSSKIIYFLALFQTHFGIRIPINSTDTSFFDQSDQSSMRTQSSESLSSAQLPPLISIITWIILGLQILFIIIAIVCILKIRKNRSFSKTSGSIWTRE